MARQRHALVPLVQQQEVHLKLRAAVQDLPLIDAAIAEPPHAVQRLPQGIEKHLRAALAPPHTAAMDPRYRCHQCLMACDEWHVIDGMQLVTSCLYSCPHQRGACTHLHSRRRDTCPLAPVTERTHTVDQRSHRAMWCARMQTRQRHTCLTSFLFESWYLQT